MWIDRQAVLQRDLQRADDLARGDRVPGAALQRAVVGDHHHLAAADDADAGDQQRLRRLAVVVPVGGQRHQLEERRAAVEQQLEPLRARSACPARRAGPSARCGRSWRAACSALAQLGGQLQVVLAVGPVGRRAACRRGSSDAAHQSSSSSSARPRARAQTSGGAAVERVADREVAPARRTPSRIATISLCIFMLSITTSRWPAATASPARDRDRDHGARHRRGRDVVADGAAERALDRVDHRQLPRAAEGVHLDGVAVDRRPHGLGRGRPTVSS